MAKICVWSIVLISLFTTLTATAAPAPEPNARKDLERLAGRLKFFSLGDFLYDRISLHRFPDEVAQQYQKLIDELTSTSYEVDALVKLLKHDDPKVRTLALAALFTRDDPRLLPHMAPLVDDKAATFSRPQLVASAVFAKKEMPPLEKQTVGDAANQFVTFYLGPANYSYGVKGTDGHGGFDAYWAARKDREFCASWFAVQLARAGQGRYPTPKDRFDKIRAVRQRIDKLPRADRAWTLLWLNGETGSDALVSEAELVAVCKELGPERLVLMLQRKIPSADPDLQPRKSNNWPYRRMTQFVLQRAATLLRPMDADALLACELWERDYIKHEIHDPTLTAWWAIAAAELTKEKEKAQALLLQAFPHFKEDYQGNERAQLAIALWRLVGPDAAKFLVKWFYDERPPYAQFPNQRATFLEGIAKHRNPENRKLLAALVRHKGYDTLDWQSLRTLVTIVNAWSDKPVVDAKLIEAAWHPYGEGGFDQAADKARKEYPKETEALLRTLSQWRSTLSPVILEWAKE
jgi:hypothetical protein